MKNLAYTTHVLVDKELLEIFPEGKQIVLDKIAEYENDRKKYIADIQEFIRQVNDIAVTQSKGDFFLWFWTDAYIRNFIATDIVFNDKNLFRLNKLKRSFIPQKNSSKNKNKIDWDELIHRAKEIPLESIAEPYLEKIRRSPNKLIALCPIRAERTPSFNINISKNRYKCFGCNAGGDSIDFLMQVEKIEFREAVRRLAL